MFEMVGEAQKGLVVFQDRKIRRLRVDNEWFYSVVDIVAVLSESDNPTTYWRVLKHREPQLVTICNGLKLPANHAPTIASVSPLRSLICDTTFCCSS